MSGIFDSIFGSEQKKETIVTTPGQATQLSPLYEFGATSGSTGAGISANASRNLFQTGFGNGAFRGLGLFEANNLKGIQRAGNLINRLGANENPFIQARVDPLRAEIANRRADLSRSISQRGVVGSLGNNELMRFDRNADRQLGDATALATNEALSSLIQAEGLAANLNEGQIGLANEYLKRDLGALGLNLEAVQLALSGRQFSNPGGTQTSTTQGGSQGVGGFLSGLGSVFTGIGGLR